MPESRTMQKLTCLTCRVSLPTSENQREHYKSDWHIYNLKRKLIQRNPVTKDEFEHVKQLHTPETEPAPNCETSLYCKTCGKTFFNQKAFDQHNLSKKHIQISTSKPKSINSSDDAAQTKDNVDDKVLASVESDEEFNESDWEEVDSDEENMEGIPLDECLFCGELAQNMELNLVHMSKMHSFFIPDLEFCVDVKGLLKYLGIKIASGRCCLWCSEFGKQFASKKSAQQHMLDKGHSKMKFENSGETLLEFEDFYDYSSSYPEGETSNEVEQSDFTLDDSDYHLKLPSGSVIGHRSLFIYYKQNLKPQSSTEVRSKNKELLNKVMVQYKSLGWTGLTTHAAVQKAKDIKFMHRIQQKNYLRMGKRHNLVLTTHLRSQQGYN